MDTNEKRSENDASPVPSDFRAEIERIRSTLKGKSAKDCLEAGLQSSEGSLEQIISLIEGLSKVCAGNVSIANVSPSLVSSAQAAYWTGRNAFLRRYSQAHQRELLRLIGASDDFERSVFKIRDALMDLFL